MSDQDDPSPRLLVPSARHMFVSMNGTRNDAIPFATMS